MIRHDSSVPIYVQLGNLISQKIEDGTYKAGDKLPSENELCSTHGISRITVRQALNLLTQKDLIYSIHGKGTFIKAPAIRHDLSKIVRFGTTLQQKGLDGYTKVSSYFPYSASEDARTALGSDFANLNMIGYASDIPIVYYRSYLTRPIAEMMYKTALEIEKEHVPFSSYDLYDRLNIKLQRVEQTIGAMAADQKLKEIFGPAHSDAFVVLESVYYKPDGSPTEMKIAYYRADVYSFKLHREF